MKRREFLQSFFRGGALLSLTAGSAALIAKKSSKNTQSCINKSICNSCTQYSDCGLPRALSIKKVRGENDA